MASPVTGIVSSSASSGGVTGSELRVLVVTVSTRAAAGEYEDRSGPSIVDALTLWGVTEAALRIVSDDEDELVRVLGEAAASGVDAVLTTGGTGLAPDDRTPEVTRRVVEREVPGIAEAIRSAGLELGFPRRRCRGGLLESSDER